MKPSASGSMSDSNEPKVKFCSRNCESVRQKLYIDLCNLIVESRVPGVNERGYGDGSHCPPLLGLNTHSCDLSKPECQKHQILIKHLLNAVSRNLFEVEVLLLPDCCLESKLNERIQNKEYILLERWSMNCNYGKMQSVIDISQLLRAVRSFLYFSQLSAWLSSTKGKAPSNLYYWIKTSVDMSATKFEHDPEVHSFPVFKIAEDLYGTVEVKYRTRSIYVPVIPCSKHPPLCSYPFITVTDSNHYQNIPFNNQVVKQLQKTCDTSFQSTVTTKKVTEPATIVAPPTAVHEMISSSSHDGRKPKRLRKHSKRQISSGNIFSSVNNMVQNISKIASVASGSQTSTIYYDSRSSSQGSVPCEEHQLSIPFYSTEWKPKKLKKRLLNHSSDGAPSVCILNLHIKQENPKQLNDSILVSSDDLKRELPDINTTSFSSNSFRSVKTSTPQIDASLSEYFHSNHSYENSNKTLIQLTDLLLPSSSETYAKSREESEISHKKRQTDLKISSNLSSDTSNHSKSSHKKSLYFPENKSLSALFMSSTNISLQKSIATSLKNRNSEMCRVSNLAFLEESKQRRVLAEIDDSLLSRETTSTSAKFGVLENKHRQNIRISSGISQITPTVLNSGLQMCASKNNKYIVGMKRKVRYARKSVLPGIHYMGIAASKSEIKESVSQIVEGVAVERVSPLTGRNTYSKAIEDFSLKPSHSSDCNNLQGTVKNLKKTEIQAGKRIKLYESDSVKSETDLLSPSVDCSCRFKKRYTMENSHQLQMKKISEHSSDSFKNSSGQCLRTSSHDLLKMSALSESSCIFQQHEVNKNSRVQISRKRKLSIAYSEKFSHNPQPRRKTGSQMLNFGNAIQLTRVSNKDGITSEKQNLIDMSDSYKPKIYCPSQKCVTSGDLPDTCTSYSSTSVKHLSVMPNRTTEEDLLANFTEMSVSPQITDLGISAAELPLKQIFRDLKKTSSDVYKNEHDNISKEMASDGGDSNLQDSILNIHRNVFSPKPAKNLVRRRNLLGNFVESMLKGGLNPIANVTGFKVEVAATGSFFPNHLTLAANVDFYELSGCSRGSAPYMADAYLGKTEYYLPKKGAVQLTLFNPSGSVVKMFFIKYNFNDLPTLCKTFIRQKVYLLPIGSTEEPTSTQWLRFIVHLRFASSRSGKIFLHEDLKIVVLNKSNDDTAAEFSQPRELKSFLSGPMIPAFSSF